MKHLLETLRGASKSLGLVAALVIASVSATAAFAAWGPSRTTFTMESPAPYVTFDSITNNPYYGDERNFTLIKDATTGATMSDQTTLVDGHEYVVQIYIHNDASETLNASGVGVAHDTTVRAAIPSSVSSASEIKAYINASNASPTEVWDDVKLAANGNFDIQYVSNSATLVTQYQSVTLGDSIATTGVKVGDQDLSGNWRGCVNQAGVIKFKIRVKAKVVDNNIKVCRLGDKTIVTIKESEFDAAKYSKNLDDCNITVCRLSDKVIVTIKSSEFDATKYSKDLNDCNVKVCRLSDKTIVTIKESEFDATKYSRNTADCKVLESKSITVCELSTKKTVTIKESDFDATKYTKTLSDCTVTPPVIPSTGPEMIAGGLLGSGALGLGISSFVRSRSALRRALRNN
jgi:hypothetical protein